MIARLRGEVAEVAPGRLTVDVHGVGYDVQVPRRLSEVTRVGEDLTLHVHTDVREDAILLFGFANAAEKAAFLQLVTVQQVGPRIALSALDTLAVPDLARAIEGNDLRALSAIPGVGKKTAERLVLELRGKLAWSPATAAATATARPPADDALPLALAQLGYKRTEIDLAVARIAEQGLADRPLPERVAAALRIFSSIPR